MNTNTIPACFGIIPARFSSSRFEGKPLAPILGKPMIWHVYSRAILCPHLQQVVLATDDDRIYDAAESLNIPVLMTSNEHTCGTDRVLEAARMLKIPADGVVINIQGDEPALEPEMLSELITPFQSPEVLVTTLAHKINQEEAQNPDQVKVVLGKGNRALYFSRSLIPFPRDGVDDGFYGHIGLYAFRMKTLEQFVSLEKGMLENKEKLEQLRLLENDFPIHVVPTKHKGFGVDRPEDIAIVEKILQNKKDV
ncbi:MAG: 3-deoxy-manno-octulosonate cytidylyltransferase [Desulfobulbaceae bacterium]|uniref:3-deoxy-manno-octulosonate cytidylyltransferase n=1 Tax=Candidatus Desulfobia pelagia TaxID=2841692 RepID=A0A8J6NCD2_9BACT|nr:3-deoxy-manno-octulosonate cytidylyltransferase [Candidatus Desulfobia pelagia]